MQAPTEAPVMAWAVTRLLLPMLVVRLEAEVELITGVAPCGPVAPVRPELPAGPATPCGPVGPVLPATPWMPCGPTGPAGPGTPAAAPTSSQPEGLPVCTP